MYGNDLELAFIVSFLATYFVIFGIMLLGSYIVNGIALTNVAKVKNLKVWKAWVPFANLDLECEATNSKRKILWGTFAGYILLAFIGGIFIAAGAGILGGIAIAICYVSVIWFIIYNYIIAYRLCKEFGVSKWLFWVGVFFGIVMLVVYIMIAINARNIIKNLPVLEVTEEIEK